MIKLDGFKYRLAQMDKVLDDGHSATFDETTQMWEDIDKLIAELEKVYSILGYEEPDNSPV